MKVKDLSLVSLLYNTGRIDLNQATCYVSKFSSIWDAL